MVHTGYTFVWILISVGLFGLGLAIGWGMRKSVKDTADQQFSVILERIQKIGWKIDNKK